MFYNALNQDSLSRIDNIVTGFRNYPSYSAYDIQSYVYDLRMGVHAIEVSKNGEIINLLLFYPTPTQDGKIESIAIYGAFLQGHLNAIKRSMLAFGMKVESVEIDHSGIEDFVDVYLEDY